MKAFICSAWLKPTEHEVVERVNRRLDLATNLEMETAEELQVGPARNFVDLPICAFVDNNFKTQIRLLEFWSRYSYSRVSNQLFSKSYFHFFYQIT
ncbi:unnamed protein product [Gongylonema pulchrum]|uniref:Uncharacterized protein n=1 Tax=Gongylonema pulchrum TaxID=637853 RepID=A0A183F1N9_9BILA|nr:unnamed protein product [Gongylonema pulchrum]